jgi:hypothetical protein
LYFYGVELLDVRPTPKLEDHLLLAVRHCLFNILAATLHIWSCVLYTQAEVTGTNIKWQKKFTSLIFMKMRLDTFIYVSFQVQQLSYRRETELANLINIPSSTKIGQVKETQTRLSNVGVKTVFSELLGRGQSTRYNSNVRLHLRFQDTDLNLEEPFTFYSDVL